MKKFLILLTSIALLCSLCGCTSSVNKETTVPLETVPATEASASGEKLDLPGFLRSSWERKKWIWHTQGFPG